MQGQVQAHPDPCVTMHFRWQHGTCRLDSPPEMVYEPNGCRNTGEYELGPAEWVECPAPPKPAEHVIEIKTVRVREKAFYVTARKAWECPAGWDEDRKYETCVRVTRELWIDGVRWGIVKGLD